MAAEDRSIPSRASAGPRPAVLRIGSKNYSSWSLRGWLLARLSGLAFTEEAVRPDDPVMRAELLLQAASIRIPCLFHDGAVIWDTLAIGEYLNELCPEAGLLPSERRSRAHCRAISGEMHAGFTALRSALPMNLRGHFPGFRLWSGPRADIARIVQIWSECLDRHGGPFLFGAAPGLADAMYAPVATRLRSYDVALEGPAASYAATLLAWPEMVAWRTAALAEPEPPIPELELDAEF